MRNSGTLAGTGERMGAGRRGRGEVVRDISFVVSPSAGIEYETRRTKSSEVMRRRKRKE